PAAVAESAEGVVYVADIGNSRVQCFSADGRPLAAWPAGASVARDGNRVAVDSAGRVLVTQVTEQAIVRYGSQGQESGRWTYAQGSAPLTPFAIAALPGDRFAVVFPDADRVVVFTP
ncbi:MAG TPA: hypothetical protein VM536_18705, partial [Chloroflexia bacterium]|nr:hypothetical protein [Chloroflexia bacterium]